MSSRRGRPSETAGPEDGPLLSSSDLFGDFVDAPMPAAPGRRAPGRRPIRVRLGDSTSKQPAAARAESQKEIEDALSRLGPSPSAPSPGGDTDAGVSPPKEAASHRPETDAPQPPRPEPGAPGATRKSVPNHFGPYTLVERVAVGGMAEVFRAKRTGVEGFEKTVAVKRILPHLSENREFVSMFVDEAKMVAGLSHPNIVQIFDLGRIDRSYYIAMEYVHGRDLRTIQKRGQDKGLRMPLDLGLRVVSQVCGALEYAHRKKDEQGRPMEIVHRDVSPQNILISFEGDVKLVDFGIARAATKAATSDRGALRGKLLYMSPEQAWGRRLDRRSDLFSLGIVLYELVTETKPFVGGGTDVTILQAVRQCLIPSPREVNPRVPDSLDRVIMKALAREPDERYQDAGQMQRGLERFLRERPPVSSHDVSRYLELLFDHGEREGDVRGEPPDPGLARPDPASLDSLLQSRLGEDERGDDEQ